LRSTLDRRNRWRFHVHDRPLRIQRVRHTLARAHDLFGLLVRADRHEHAIPGHPGTRGSIGDHRGARRCIDAIGHAPQRQFA